MTTTTDLFSPAQQGSANPDNQTYSADGKVDAWNRYRLPDPVSGRVKPWTRATTFAKSISDTYTLNMWGRRMSIKGLSQRPDLLALAAATPLEDRERLNKIAEDAAEHAGSKSGASLGTALHAFCEQVDGGQSPFIPSPWDADVAAYRASMDAAHLGVADNMIERLVIVPQFDVAGTLDRIVVLPEPCEQCGLSLRIADLKTGRDLSYGWLEISVQLALYAHAGALWNAGTKSYEVTGIDQLCRCSAVVMHLPVGEAKCTLYDVDIQIGWEMADLCHQVRLARKRRDLASPRAATFALVEGRRTTLVVDRPPTYEERIAVARTTEELSALWREGTERGEWTTELTQLGKQRQAALAAG